MQANSTTVQPLCACGCGTLLVRKSPYYQAQYAVGHNRRSWVVPPEERFWSKVHKTDRCWLWTASTKNGYGNFYLAPGQWVYAHRFSYELHYGPIPDDQLVCHSCDTYYPIGDISYRLCVRPDHFFLGSHADNSLDMSRKRRYHVPMLRGSESPTAKLTESDIRKIRALYATTKFTCKDIGQMFGVHASNIHIIVKRKGWTHI